MILYNSDIIKFFYDNKYSFNRFVEINSIKNLYYDLEDRDKIYKGLINELKEFYSY